MESGKGRLDTDSASVMSSTISLGDPLEIVAPENTNDPEVEAEFSKVVDGIKDTTLNEDSPISRRPSRPHHSGQEMRNEHPLSPQSTTTPSKENQVQNTMPLSRCLFCNYDSPNLKLSIMHMTKFHALFIPEQPYLVDLEGLVKYLQEKIMEDYECLFCHKLKGSASGVQTHMRDKGHCMIAFDTEDEMIEVGQFYDFRSTYSDEEDDTDSDSEVPAKGNMASKLGTKWQSPHADEENEGWETDSSASVDTTEITALPIDQDYSRLASHRHHTHSDPRPHHAPDGFHSHAHSHHAAFHSDHELHLPTGRTAGHRSLARYYRQNLHNYPTPEERSQRLITAGASHEDEDLGNAHGRQITTRGEGGLGMLGVSDAKKKEVANATKRDQKRAQRHERQYEWGVNKRANAQKHYRDPLLQ